MVELDQRNVNPYKVKKREARNWRWWMPSGIVVLCVAALAGLHYSNVYYRAYAAAGVVVLGALLLALWAILFTGLSLRGRLAGLGLLLILILGIGFVVKNFTRYEGSYSGSGFPRLVWIWTPPLDADLPPLQPMGEMAGVEEGTRPADLDFPEFLGPGRSNVVRGVQLVAGSSKHPPEEKWRQPVGLGWSGFSIAGERAVTQEQRGEYELIVCYHLLTGQPLWAHTNEVRFSESLGGDGPRATPTIHEQRVYAMGATGILDCLDLETGGLIWSQETLENPYSDNLTWGRSCSPLIVDELVVVSGGAVGPLLMAFTRESGSMAWKSGAGSSSYASPTLATIAGRRQILSVNAQSVTGHDPETGKLLWRYNWPGAFPKASQPVAIGPDKVFLSAGYGLGARLLQLVAEEGEMTVTELWSSPHMKTKFANVAVHKGYIFGLDEGILACVDLETGARMWKDGRYGHGQVLLVGEMLLVQAEAGHVALVEATPERHREVSRWPALSSKTWNNPALAGNYLLLRNDQEAVCFDLPLR